ncbi:unnamed protein product [Coccothraustes coccothraustes]
MTSHDTSPHSGAPACSKTEGSGGVLAAGRATDGGVDVPTPAYHAAPERPVPQCLRCGAATRAWTTAPVTVLQLHATPETTAPPPRPPAPPIATETPRPPPPVARWPSPNDIPPALWSLAMPLSEDVPTPPIQPLPGGRAPPQSQI